MIPCKANDENSQLTAENIAQIRQEIAALHKDVLQAVRYLSMITAAIGDLRVVAAHVDARLAPPKTTANTDHHGERCHSCGARVSLHPAEAGVLLLCPVCGWSEFVARDGAESAEVRPDPVPPCPRSNHWAA